MIGSFPVSIFGICFGRRQIILVLEASSDVCLDSANLSYDKNLALCTIFITPEVN